MERGLKIEGGGGRNGVEGGGGNLLAGSPGDVDGLELIETGQHTGSGHTSQHVGAGALHHGHEALVLEDLHAAVDGGLVLDGSAGSHHHTPSDGIDGVGHETGDDADGPAEQEGGGHTSVSAQQHGLQGVVQTEVHTSVDEDTDGGDGESTAGDVGSELHGSAGVLGGGED